jgi:P-type conjugative transfer protein TrbJ
MKKLLITIAIAIVGASSHAQWIVYDPTVNIEQIVSEAENIAQFVSMVDNQVQQITQLSDQLQQLQQYNKAFGDPSQILNVTGISALTSDLTQTPLGETISTVEQSANGVADSPTMPAGFTTKSA